MTDVLSGLDAAGQARVAALRAQGRFFWLDASLSETSRADLGDALGVPDRVIGSVAGSRDAPLSRSLHADGESVRFVLRCYVEAATGDEETTYRLRPLEVHVLVTGDYVLTLHDERISLPEALGLDLPEDRAKQYVVYSILDAMLESTFDALEEVELRLDAAATTWTDPGGGVPRSTLREAGARLAKMRRWGSVEQAVFERIGVEIGALRGFDPDDQPSFDRLGEQTSRLLASIDAAANAMAMLLDLQLNERAYVVSVVATVFVPLTFITGFFGMNFGWMVDHIDSPIAFWLLGFIVPLATAVLAWRTLVRRFLIGDNAPARRTQ